MKKILCAAIHFKTGKKHSYSPKNIEDGIVICGYRHSNIIAIACMIEELNIDEGIQGFLTDENEFVTREEALIIAREANQLKKNTHPLKLYSEDLY